MKNIIGHGALFNSSLVYFNGWYLRIAHNSRNNKRTKAKRKK